MPEGDCDEPGRPWWCAAYPLPETGALEPPERWAESRVECPVAGVRLPSGDAALPLTRYDDVKRVLSDPWCTRSLGANDAARISDNESGGVFNDFLRCRSSLLPGPVTGAHRTGDRTRRPAAPPAIPGSRPSRTGVAPVEGSGCRRVA